MIADFWNNRFAVQDYIYGESPNEFFRTSIEDIPAGKLLLPAEGEGRNAVFAAKSGWNVEAFDWSATGKEKAEKLATKNNVTINYTVADLNTVSLPPETFDAAALLYLHLLPEERKALYIKIFSALKTRGIIILEAFSTAQLGKTSGGPQDLSVLYSLEDIVTDFIEYDFLHLSEEEIDLQEGLGHRGAASVIRFIGKKP
jgi:ubiquinone/menaquinone biosynthesis C-methylase UbiE